MTRLALRLLGPLRVQYGGKRLKLETRKSLALLIYLAVNRGYQRKDLLETLLWPEKDHTHAGGLLRRSVYVLRKALGRDWILTDRQTIALNSTFDVWVDANCLYDLAARCGEHQHEGEKLCDRCCEVLTEAIDLYDGQFLAGFSLKDSVNFDDWQSMQDQSLTHTVIESLELVTSHLRKMGELSKGISYVRRWLEIDPMDEAAYRQAMQLYAEAGPMTEVVILYRACERVLRRELGIAPDDETLRLYESIKNQRSLRSRVALSEGATRGNLPRQLTSFIGRQREMTEVGDLLVKNSLVTLTGSGGCGKTRLALEVASAIRHQYQDGVWLIQLAPVSDPKQIPAVTASALGLHQRMGASTAQIVEESLRHKHALLLVDNCEHIVEAAAGYYHSLLLSSENLAILATSREPLNVGGEQVWRVRPLVIPDPQQAVVLTADRLPEYESTNLFVERARSAVPGMEVSDSEAPIVGSLCRRLSGIPLAVELAAAKVRSLTIEQIFTRLDGYFRLLTTESRTVLPRHKTLFAAIDWSHNLLTKKERVLFRRLSVFTDGWSLEAAEAICSMPADENVSPTFEGYETMDLIGQLVDKSMIIKEDLAGQARYWFLETIRQYAQERLDKSEESETVGMSHRDYYLALAERCEPGLYCGPNQVACFDQLRLEYGNLRTAIQCPVSNRDGDTGLRFGAALWWFWFIRGHYEDGKTFLVMFANQALDRTTAIFGRVTFGLATTLWLVGDLDSARFWGEQSFGVYERLGDQNGMGYALFPCALERVGRGDNDGACERLERALDYFQATGDEWGVVNVLRILGVVRGNEELLLQSMDIALILRDKVNLALLTHDIANLAQQRGDYTRAVDLLNDSIELAQETHSGWGVAQSLMLLASVEAARGRRDHARGSWVEALKIYGEMGLVSRAAMCLTQLAALHLDLGETERAAQLIGQIDRLRVSAGVLPDQENLLTKYASDLRERLGDDFSSEAWRQGNEMSLAQVVDTD